MYRPGMIDLRNSSWEDIANFVLALRAIAEKSAFSMEVVLKDVLLKQMERLIRETALDDYLAAEGASESDAQVASPYGSQVIASVVNRTLGA